MLNHLETPIGTLILESRNGFIVRADFGNPVVENSHTEADELLLKRAFIQLSEYFEGKRKQFDIPVNPVGTEFQKKIWKEVNKVPFGKTASYGQLSKGIGNVRSVRAVGTANGANPVLLLIPCHRIIAGDGKLIGYSGGLERKSWLLRHESFFSGNTLFI